MPAVRQRWKISFGERLSGAASRISIDFLIRPSCSSVKVGRAEESELNTLFPAELFGLPVPADADADAVFIEFTVRSKSPIPAVLARAMA